MNYKEFNDNEIIYCIKENNEEANELMFKKYKPLIEKIARNMYKYANNLGLELNDLIQEGLLAFSNAIITFDETKDITFYTYAKSCVEKKMISLLIKNKSLKHKLLNESVPFEIDDDEGTHLLFGNVLLDSESNPEDKLILKEEKEALINKIKLLLTPFEIEVFDLKVNGFDYKEIAVLLSKDSKSIDNAIQRIKSKLKNINNN